MSDEELSSKSNMPDASDNWRLEVYRADHKIGTLTLPEAGFLTVGRGTEYDVVLRDVSIANTKLHLEIEKPQILVKVIEGTVVVDGHIHACGEQFLCDTRKLLMGSLALRFRGVEAQAVTQMGTEGEQPQATTKAHSAMLGNRRLITAVIVASVLTICGVGSWQVLASLRADPPTAESLLRSFIKDADLDQLSVEKDGDDLVVSGTLRSNKERMRLESFLRQQPFRVKQQLVNLEQLKSQLEDVLRVNGIAADVTIDDSGVLQAATQISDAKQIELVRQAVAADVPQLQHWKINNVPSPAAPDKLVREDPGKQVAMVISDEPAHVLTVDQTRYFIGSMLPSGHRIDDIRDGRVFLVKGSTRSELEF